MQPKIHQWNLAGTWRTRSSSKENCVLSVIAPHRSAACRSVFLRGRTFPGFRLLDKMGAGKNGGADMTEQTHSAATARHRFLHAVQRELAEAERREREFSKADRQERAAQLQILTSQGVHLGGARDGAVKN